MKVKNITVILIYSSYAAIIKGQKMRNVCLTWLPHGHGILLICSFTNHFLGNKVKFFSRHGRELAECPGTFCPSLNANFKSQNEITLSIEDQRSNLEGEWACAVGDVLGKTTVSFSKGISRLVDINIDGQYQKSDDGDVFNVSCSSCWNPLHNNVEFLRNNKSLENVRIVNGSCFNTQEICRPDQCECSMTPPYFKVTLHLSNHKSYLEFSCEMRFQDISILSFKKRATIVFNGTEFKKLDTSTAYESPGDTTSNTDEGSGISTQTVIGIVVPFVATIIIVFGVFAYIIKRRGYFGRGYGQPRP